MSKLLNRRGYNDKENCIRILNKYYEDFLDDSLEDHLKFEVFIMYLEVRHQYANLNLKKVLSTMYYVDYDDITEWLEDDISELDRGRLVSTGYRSINTLIKKEGVNLTDRELCTLEYVLEALR